MGRFVRNSSSTFSGGKFVYDCKLLKIGLSGQFESLKTIYTSSHTSEIHDVAYDAGQGRFLVAGGIKDKLDYIYANPILNVYDMEGNLLVDKYYSWDQADDYFTGIYQLPSSEIALLGYERESNYNYSYHRLFILILNSAYDSIRRFNLPFDSIVSVKYLNFISPTEIEMIGMRENGPDPVHQDQSLYMLFYMKFFANGVITEMKDLMDYVYATGNITLDYHDPMKVYYYEETGLPDSRINFETYSLEGLLINAAFTQVLYHKKIQPNTDIVKVSPLDGGIILSGQFIKSNSPAAPTYYGNYLIKLDQDMKEQYRLIFNEDINDIMFWTSSADEIDPDHFLLLSDYSGGFTMTILNAADTLSK